jgi:hypothetical protein
MCYANLHHFLLHHHTYTVHTIDNQVEASYPVLSCPSTSTSNNTRNAFELAIANAASLAILTRVLHYINTNTN